MELEKYFEQEKGIGVLSTADASGKVNAAVYARPHFMADGTVAFIMGERLTHENLESNPWAAYLFVEEGKGYQGKRLYLKKTRDEKNSDLVTEICRRCDYSSYDISSRHVVFFTIENVLPLIVT
jgi:hypothetical protein